MPTTNKPAPVATGTDPGLYNPTVGPVGPLDTAPEPVPAGPGLGTTATVPNTVPVVTAQTETVDVATASNFVPNTISTNTVVKYLSVSDESVAVNGQVTNLNFVGTGVSVANNANAINSVTVTIGGGATYGNSNVVTLLAGFGSNVLSTTGNVTGGNLITGAQVVASGVIQSGTGLSTGGYLSVDGDADLHKTTVTGNLSATGNITGSYVLGNGSQLTGLPATYSNSNVQAYLPTYSGNIGALTVTGNLTVTGTTSTVNTEVVNVSESVVGNIDAGNLRTAGQVSATGNITGNFFIGNGSTLSSVTAANVVGTVANATYATSAGSATTATTAGTANAVAGANVSGTVANATYALTSNAATYSTQATYADTANAVAGANVSGTVANATYATSAGSATTAGTVTTAAQANITSVGTLTSLSISGNLSATGNVTGNYFIGNGSQLTGVTATSYNLITTDTFSVFIPPAGGETRFANVALNSECSQVVFQRVSGSTDYNYLTYTLDGSNPLTSPTAISVYLPNGATQRITVVGGSQLNSTLTGGTNSSGAVLTYYQYSTYYINSYNNANVATFLAAYGSNTVSTTGNITAGNIIATNVGNIASLNLNSNASTVLYGNGTFASLPASSSYGNANVTTLLGNLGSNVISSTGNISTTANISGGYILGNGSQLTSLPAPTVAQDITSVGAMSIMTYDGNLKYASYATVEPASGNITAGNISTVGKVIAGNLDAINLVVNNISSDDSTLVSVQDGLQVYGNIIADNLGNIASINLDGNVSNVLSGTGTWIAAGGGGGNTGNVTFNDVNVIGTGNLNLQPNSASSEYLNIYLTGAADIHVAYGGGSGNVILGTDEEANVAVLLNGNVAIQAGNVGGTKTWNFDTAGNLTLPLNSVVYETNIPDGALSGSAIALKPTGGTTVNQQLLIYPTANDGDHIHMTSGNLYTTELFLGSDNFYVKLANTGNVVINSNDGNSSNAMWTFDTAGNLTLPGNTFSVNYANGTAVSLSGSYGNAEVVANLAALGTNPVSTTGNITAGYLFGNGSQITGLPATYGNADVSTFLAAYGNNTVSTTGNITSGNILTGGIVSAIGNITTANSFVGNLVGTTVSITGNISAGNVIVNGQPTTYGVANLTTGVVAIQATATGTVTATVVANTSPNLSSFSNGTSTSPATTVFTLSIPSAGTWQLESWIRTFSTTGTPLISGGFYTGGTLVANSETLLWPSPVTNANGAGYMSATVTTTGAETYTVGLWSTTTGIGLYSDSTGRTKAQATQISSIFALNALDTMATTGNVSVGGNLTVTGGIRKSARVLTSTTTLTVADASGFIELTPGGGPYTITLPNPTLAANSGIGYRFWQNTTDNITLSTPAGAFYGPSGSSASTQVLVQATTQYWDVWSDGFNWAVFGIKIA